MKRQIFDKVNITLASMPLIERNAFPDLPDDMEARLFNVPDQDPKILLIHAASEMFIEVPLTDRENIGTYVESLNIARLRQAMGDPPDADDGYKVG